jgi:hypothetical protein
MKNAATTDRQTTPLLDTLVIPRFRFNLMLPAAGEHLRPSALLIQSRSAKVGANNQCGVLEPNAKINLID